MIVSQRILHFARHAWPLLAAADPDAEPLATMPKRQQFHATSMLCARDAVIADEEKILRKLMNAAREGIKRPGLRVPLNSHPALYTRYRRLSFPIRTDGNRKHRAWRSLSPWMKLQLMSICIAEHPHVQIRLRLHDEIVDKLAHEGKDYRSHLRDRMTKRFRERFADEIQFLFVLEDMDRDSTSHVRTHAHGMVMLPNVDVTAMTDGRTKAAYHRQVAKYGQLEASFVTGRKMLKEVLQEVVGNREGRPRKIRGIDQTDNVWTKRSYNPLFNHEAISYAFKNVDSSTSALPANRIARSKKLVTEGRRFWDLIRLGEPAITAWPND